MLEIIGLSLLLIAQQEKVNMVEETGVLKPAGYEENILVLDNVSFMAGKLEEGEALIVISHLGKGENPIYNKRRLYTVKTYLKLPANKIVSAVGEPVNGYGYLEFYIKGKKVFSLAVHKNQELWVAEGHPRFFKSFPYYLPKPRHAKRYKHNINK